jgi:phosphohistidine phosphatase
MVRELLLLRHGKSSANGGDDDFHRPLTDRGKRGAQRIGVYLATHKMIPDHVISSPAERAQVTAEKCLKAMGQGAGGIVQDHRIYHAGSEELLDVVRQAPAAATRVMIVGHNPGLEELLLYLTGGTLDSAEDGKLLPTATLAVLRTDHGWQDQQPGGARLAALIRPRTLPKKFPWPLMEGREQRDRPAYYYQQSAVIPYRISAGEPEILLVRSSKNKHWVVPKGIHEPGLTPQESARKEAVEEAGVEGVIAAQAIGRYSYEKWGAACSVDVFAMQVTHVIPESEWQESHRTRQWVSLEQAASMVREPRLGPLILAVEKHLRDRAANETTSAQR